MSEAEKKAIEKLKEGKKIGIYEVIRTFKKEGIENFVITRKKYIETILKLIEKPQKEIEKLLKAYKQDEKIIQEMAEFIYGNDTIFYLPKDVNTKQEVIDYFRKRCKQ